MERVFLELWNSNKNNTPHITFCDYELHPMFTVEYKSEEDRNKNLKRLAEKPYHDIYNAKDKLYQLNAYLYGLEEQGYYGITKATKQRITALKQEIQGIETFLKIKKGE